MCVVTGAIINERGLYCRTCNTSFIREGGGGGGGFRLPFLRQRRLANRSKKVKYPEDDPDPACYKGRSGM